MPRFFVDGPLAAGKTLPLPDDVVRHVHVLRLQTGDAITLFDGAGGEYQANSSKSRSARPSRASTSTAIAKRSRRIA